MSKLPLVLVLLPFGALSAAALWRHGYWGLFEPQLQSLAGVQVLADLGIALSLFAVWMWRDARAQGRNPWPWLVMTLALGSFGPLLYLLLAPAQVTSAHVTAGAPAGRGHETRTA